LEIENSRFEKKGRKLRGKGEKLADYDLETAHRHRNKGQDGVGNGGQRVAEPRKSKK